MRNPTLDVCKLTIRDTYQIAITSRHRTSAGAAELRLRSVYGKDFTKATVKSTEE